MMNGQIDAAPLPEPLATFSELKNGLLRQVDYRDAWAQVAGGQRRSPQVSLFVTEEYARAHETLLLELVSLWRMKTQDTVIDPARAAGISASYIEMPPDIIEKAIRNTEYFVPSFDENRSLVLEYYNMVKDYLPKKRDELDKSFFFLHGQEER
jgi:ABC-type nitrate/sulfonate/bicarbonate transport system substrate-binding protein